MKRKITEPLFCRIDVTAFASVMLVLAFAFLIHRIWPPQNAALYFTASSAQAKHAHVLHGADREDAIVIAITRDGKIFFGPDYLEFKQLPPQQWPLLLQQQVRSGAERRAYLQVESRTRYEHVQRVLDIVRSAGIENISFTTRQN